MALAVNHGAFLLRIATPEHEYQVIALLIELTNGGIGEFLPALALVRTGIALLHRQCGIEQEHALLRPLFQVAVAGRSDAKIAFEFLVDIHQRGRNAHALAHGKTQAMGLVRPVVRILPSIDI